MPKRFHNRRKTMADPVLISAAVGLITRLIDKNKPLGKTNLATGAGLGLGGVAAMLIQGTSPEEQVIGYVVGAIAAGLTLYRESKNKNS